MAGAGAGVEKGVEGSFFFLPRPFKVTRKLGGSKESPVLMASMHAPRREQFFVVGIRTALENHGGLVRFGCPYSILVLCELLALLLSLGSASLDRVNKNKK